MQQQQTIHIDRLEMFAFANFNVSNSTKATSADVSPGDDVHKNKIYLKL